MQVFTLNQTDRFFRHNKDYLIIGCTPHEEQCTQCGYDNTSQSRTEARIYAEQLKRTFGKPPEGSDYFILKNSYDDVGYYYEVAIAYDMGSDEDQENEINSPGLDFALSVESGCEHWDGQALMDLIEAEHPFYYKASPEILKVSKKE